jgi:hypothetical protein
VATWSPRSPPTTPVPATSNGSDLTVDQIEFPETRAYVEDVLRRQQEYRHKYAKELGYGG